MESAKLLHERASADEFSAPGMCCAVEAYQELLRKNGHL